MKIYKFALIGLCTLFIVGLIATVAMMIKQTLTDIMINDNITSFIQNVKYRNPVAVDGAPLIAQKISCGYACIEMMSEFLEASPAATEDAMFAQNGKRILTSTTEGMYRELKKQFPEYEATMRKNLKNSELIGAIYESLSGGMPAICLYAAPNEAAAGEKDAAWVLHCGIVVGMDIPGDKITLNDPYGHTDTYSVRNFLKATRFDAYENMPFYLKLGFAFGTYTKNTVYTLEKKP